jgi:endogenous inhibitor of DNA gyrase (YacG/DUF329 family)
MIMSMLTCIICGKTFDSAVSNSMPFCSVRCKQVDLGRWLNEEQRLPYVRLDEDEEGEGDSPAD